MKASPLADYAEFILVSAVVGWEKPGPEIFRLALEQAGAAPHEALFVGDSFEHDVLGALGVGIPAIWLSKNPDGRAKGLPPSQFSVLEHIGQLPDFLARLAPQGKECGSLA